MGIGNKLICERNISSNKIKVLKFFKKYHKWLGIVASLFLLVFSISGIVLNHRSLFSSVDVSRTIMPVEYQYKNWNNASVRSSIQISPDSVLVYGNMGIWLSQPELKTFSKFTNGFPKGIDHKKTCKIFKDSKGRLFAGSLFGLYQYNTSSQIWNKILLPQIDNPRIVDIIEKDGELWFLTRSEILKTTNLNQFSIFYLPEPEGYDNKVSLFKTFWLIHSGEIIGFTGKIIVDIIALIFIFLTLTGLFFFFNKRKLKKKKVRNPKAIKSRNRFYLIWHNRIGWASLVFLLITTVTGMFLRPPLLIPIAESKVGKIPYTHIDTPNPWYDQLRRIYVDESKDRVMIATIKGMYYSDNNFRTKLKAFTVQPPISIMGVNAFEKVGENQFLVGSFEGLFLWNTESGLIYDYIDKKPYIKPIKRGAPIGKYLVAGYFKDHQNQEYIFDFNKGLLNSELLDPMPKQIVEASPISLWNMAVEYHTGRIYKIVLGSSYILVVPIIGLMNIFIMISGFIVWWKRYRNKTQSNYLDS